MNKKSFEDILKNMLKVSDVIKILEKMNQDSYVGIKGHFGEFYGMDKHAFFETKSYVTDNGSWDSNNIKEIDIVELSVTDIGECPD